MYEYDADNWYESRSRYDSAVDYVLMAVEFLLIWHTSALLVGFVMLVIAAPNRPEVVGIGLDPICVPGTILGFIAALRSMQVKSPGPKPKQTPPR